ncbi:hypothetical protein DEU56DRAFT_788005 [Suillus clintonianus]|uniref:uncharacterized protein n=1 Tax=Suillus clintonianus TaxID=1904413 RepID=UPI001B87091F|nr:uncharacterized protein DEU56DRAFT_788005 [Suillus clintonianus]KAG2145788.1 hypothetical protein DEU56DRAFT_788005 [Suillus clintonianus]
MNPATQKRVADDLEDSEDREVKRVKMDDSAIKNDPDFTLDPELDGMGRQKYKCLFDGESILASSYARHIGSKKHNHAKEKSNGSCPVRSPIPDAFQMHFAEHAGKRDGGAQSSSMYSGPVTPNAIENMQMSSPVNEDVMSWETTNFADTIVHPVSPEAMVTETTHVPSSPQLPVVMVTEAAEDLDFSSTLTETEDLNIDHWLDVGIGANLPLEGDIVDMTAASMSSDFMTPNVPILPPADEVSSSSEEGPFAGLPAYLLSIRPDVLEWLPFFIDEVPPQSSSPISFDFDFDFDSDVDINAASMSSDFMAINVPVLPPADEVSSSSEEGPPTSYSSIYFDFDFDDEI